MKNVVLFVLLLTIGNPLLCQLTIPTIKHGSNDKSFTEDPLIKSLVDQSEIVILFRGHSSWTWNAPFRGIYFTKNKLWHYCKVTFNYKEKTIANIDVPEDSIRKIWKSIVANDILGLSDERQIVDTCSAMIFDSIEFEFRIITPTEYKRINYIDPEFFEKNCPGNVSRQKIIKCVKEIYARKQ